MSPTRSDTNEFPRNYSIHRSIDDKKMKDLNDQCSWPTCVRRLITYMPVRL